MRTAWITGGGRGIGRAVAEALAGAGWRCALTGRDAGALAEVAAAVGGLALPADVADPEAVMAAVARLDRIDLVVLSAGIGLFAPVVRTTVADLDRLHAVHVRGTMVCCQAALPHLRRSRGAVIGIGSVMSVATYPGQGAYAASKHAMLALLKTLAKEEAAAGVRVAAVLPGAVDTAMARASRPDLDPTALIRPATVAQAVLAAAQASADAWVDEIRLRRAGATPFATA
jgi:NAD(P)-dependent dehydrogenase (short-subunit alcohol dehydrogenase family)